MCFNTFNKNTLRFLFLVCIISSLLLSIIIYFIAYIPKENFNKRATEKICLIDDYYIVNSSSSYDNGLDGYIDVIYSMHHEILSDLIIVYHNEKNYSALIQKMEDNYKIGSNIKCYIDPDNIHDVRLHKFDNRASLAFFIIFMIISVLFFVGFLVQELIYI